MKGAKIKMQMSKGVLFGICIQCVMKAKSRLEGMLVTIVLRVFVITLKSTLCYCKCLVYSFIGFLSRTECQAQSQVFVATPMTCQQYLACTTGGLAGPARYKSAPAKRENEREAQGSGTPRSCSRFALSLVYRAGTANPPVLQAFNFKHSLNIFGDCTSSTGHDGFTLLAGDAPADSLWFREIYLATGFDFRETIVLDLGRSEPNFAVTLLLCHFTMKER